MNSRLKFGPIQNFLEYFQQKKPDLWTKIPALEILSSPRPNLLYIVTKKHQEYNDEATVYLKLKLIFKLVNFIFMKLIMLQ